MQITIQANSIEELRQIVDYLNGAPTLAATVNTGVLAKAEPEPEPEPKKKRAPQKKLYEGFPEPWLDSIRTCFISGWAFTRADIAGIQKEKPNHNHVFKLGKFMEKLEALSPGQLSETLKLPFGCRYEHLSIVKDMNSVTGRTLVYTPYRVTEDGEVIYAPNKARPFRYGSNTISRPMSARPSEQELLLERKEGEADAL